MRVLSAKAQFKGKPIAAVNVNKRFSVSFGVEISSGDMQFVDTMARNFHLFQNIVTDVEDNLSR